MLDALVRAVADRDAVGGERRAQRRAVERDPVRGYVAELRPQQPPVVREVVWQRHRGQRPARHRDGHPAGGDDDVGGVGAVEVQQRPQLVDGGHRQQRAHRRAVDGAADPGHGEPVPVGGDQPDTVRLDLQQHAGQHRQVGVGADGEAYGVHGGGEAGAGQHEAGGHDGLLRVDQATDPGEFATRVGQAVLQAAQVRVQQPVHLGRPVPVPQCLGDAGQRHPDPAQPCHQPCRVHLLPGVPAVAGHRVHPGRGQHPGTVVEPQRADRQPAGPGQLADAAKLALHGRHPVTSSGSRVNLTPAACGT